MPCHVIWIAHPIPGVKIEGSGANVKVTKVNPIVTYGSKVAGIVPGNFSEIYQFSKMSNWDASTGKSSTRYIVDTDAVGDDFAKSNIGITGTMDITDQLFYEVWKDKVAKHKEEMNNALNETAAKSPTAFVPSFVNTISITDKKWNAEKGSYE
jgi:hypothetical protein